MSADGHACGAAGRRRAAGVSSGAWATSRWPNTSASTARHWDADAAELGRRWRAQLEREPSWGMWGVPLPGLLPDDMTGLDAIELGCGTAYVSAWMARRGATVVGIDNSEAPARDGPPPRCRARRRADADPRRRRVRPVPRRLVRLRHLRVRRGDLVRPVRVDPRSAPAAATRRHARRSSAARRWRCCAHRSTARCRSPSGSSATTSRSTASTGARQSTSPAGSSSTCRSRGGSGCSATPASTSSISSRSRRLRRARRRRTEMRFFVTARSGRTAYSERTGLGAAQALNAGQEGRRVLQSSMAA